MSAVARILVVGDMHFADRSRAILPKLEKRILKHTAELKPDVVVYLGDNFDRFGNTTHVMSKQIISFFAKASELGPIKIIVGNHDIPNKNDFMSDSHGYTGLKHYWNNTTVVDTVCHQFEVNGLVFQALPYCANGRFLEGLETLEARDPNPIAIFCHQEFMGADLDGMRSTTGDEWAVEGNAQTFIISGHIHKRQMLGKIGGPRVYYPGSPYQDKVDEYYSEPDDKGISLITFHCDRSWEEQRIPLYLPVKQKLTLTAKKFKKWKLEENHIYYVTICGTTTENAKHRGCKKVRAIESAGGKVTFSNTGTTIDTSVKSPIKEQQSLEKDMMGRIEDKPYLHDIHKDIFKT